MESDKTENGFSPSTVPTGRFAVSKGTLRADRFMNWFIMIGGLGVIAAVFAIFFFILVEVWPLFQGAAVRSQMVVETNTSNPIALGADEWGESPFILDADLNLIFVNRNSRDLSVHTLDRAEDFKVSSSKYVQDVQELLLASDDGRYQTVKFNFTPKYKEDGSRQISPGFEQNETVRIANETDTVLSIDGNESSRQKTIVVVTEDKLTGLRKLIEETSVRKRTLFGKAGQFTRHPPENLTELLPSPPVRAIAGTNGDSIIASMEDQSVAFIHRDANGWELDQVFQPFDPGLQIASMNFIQGKVSISFTSSNGENHIFSLTPTDSGLQYLRTHTLPPLKDSTLVFAPSPRNKAFLLANEREISLRYTTTDSVRWWSQPTGEVTHALIGEKYDTLLTLTRDGFLTFFQLSDPYPEASLSAYFGKIWYEGQKEPKFIWQSTGGTDEFEPKLSMVPLIFGSLKGTFYALMFAVPIAILSAIYTSQFLKPELKRIVKPAMEIMASLPSVVLGFIGALWLAPLVESHIPSLLLVGLSIPVSAVIIGYIWNQFPLNVRVSIPQGMEFLVFIPFLLIVGWIAWHLGPVLESLIFSVRDPETGNRIADFRLWCSEFTGSTFQQRNSLVVGFMMGFAVIPIIFTIAEDAMSAVPSSLVSASLALGASRWQTTAHVILPTASAGIFSALMIGFGRAVGETMIMVMATGNTPIMDFNIFNGMRPLSANIAIELPEAPHGGTLYHTLFLSALLLFILTFAINTVAEIMRDRLRNRFKVYG